MEFSAQIGGENTITFTSEQLNSMTFVGIDAHPTEHTALAINRFEEEKSHLRFENTKEGIVAFKEWLVTVEQEVEKVVIGIEGGSTARHALLSHILKTHDQVFEVNPLYTKQRRMLGTKGDKSDVIDARLIAEVLTKKLEKLPQIISEELGSYMLSLKKKVWYYEEATVHGARLKNQLYKLKREDGLSINTEEKRFLTFLVKEKQKELGRIKKTKTNLESTLTQHLSGYGGNLTSIPGVGTILAARILAHTNNIQRFKNQAKYICYAGIAPREKSSGKSKRYLANSKGNRRLNSVFFFAALIQIQHNPKAKEYYERKIAEGKTKRQAIVLVMRNLAVLVYLMLRSGGSYKV